MYSLFASLVELLARVLEPVFALSATAAAIVVFTMLVRIAFHPLARAAVRGEKARAALAPQLAVLRKKYAKQPERMQKEILALHAEAKVSPFSGMLPMLVQLPVFFVMYHVFSSAKVGGEVNELLGHRLFAAPLGSRWSDALGDGGVFGAQGVVYLGVFALIACVATWSFRRARRNAASSEFAQLASGAGTSGTAVGAGLFKWLPLLSFGTIVTAAVVPLAAGLYLVTTTAWTVAERAWLQRERPAKAEKAALAGQGAG
ncbi:YidC/Oxa1 family membrane protein insertase [Streptomyces sp. NBC_00237]|uniref:YidC/Oxa1 family membrane protein insertase n=1 Tax=Streptomyces sp. NBC_00237 TaxID=2975687 RepID=UPI0022503574|nr:YidC/Oxa1 family membrane protein insertase [Streptomyces sp. NBC_00237]MCX5200968.1 YidC/Oxa1 family membrane protein insertase [Streptomyces sp. NBC_00237]